MMDVSDGLLIDAARMAQASGLAVRDRPRRNPAVRRLSRLSPATTSGARIAAATAGDDYQLLFAAPADFASPVPLTRIGVVRGRASA